MNGLTSSLPQTFSAVLNVLETEAGKLEQYPQLKKDVLALRFQIDHYTKTYESAQSHHAQIVGELPAQIAQTRAYMQLQTVLDGHQKHVEHTVIVEDMLKNAKKNRFDTLHSFGLNEVRDSQHFYEEKALIDLEADGEGINPPHKAHPLKRFALNASKAVIGLMTAASIDMLFNPDHYPALTAVAVVAGLGLSLLMLSLASSLAYRAKLASAEAKRKYMLLLFAVVGCYLITEGLLNYEGVISVSRQTALEAVTDGQLIEEGNTTPAPSLPHHFSLLAFTLCFVAFAALLSALEGRDKAAHELEQRRLRVKVAKLKKDKKMHAPASQIDEVQFLESVRAKLKAPEARPLLNWHVNVVRHLTKQEAQRDRKAGEVNAHLTRQAEQIRGGLLDLTEAIHRAQMGQPEPKRRALIPFTRSA